MVSSDLFSFNPGSYYLLKNEKMIMLLQIIEQGNNYIVYSVKGAELQETTVCHAEENEYINNVGTSVFKEGKMQCNFPFSLSPYKSIKFSIYDDSKSSLSGVLENPEFGELTRKTFMRILAMKLQDYY